MKKLLAIFCLLIASTGSSALALEPQKTINLHSDGVYILSIEKRPIDIQVTNPRILEVTSTSDIFSTSSQLVMTTQEEGISYITYKQGNVTYTIKVLIDNQQDVDSSVIELDSIKDITKDK